MGRIIFILCPFPDESADVYQIRCQSVQLFDSFPRHLNLWPPKTPQNTPWCIVGRLVFSLCPFPDESADANQSWCQSDSFLIRLNCWPPNTAPPPQYPPCVSRGNLFGVYPFTYEFAQVCQIWCQSAQPFGSFSRSCAKVSSAFRRCTRWLAQKHAKKQHLYIENYNSGPNMQTSTSLTFFTAIFVAFSGALAEELMIFCRHVRTELYIDMGVADTLLPQSSRYSRAWGVAWPAWVLYCRLSNTDRYSGKCP